MGSNKFILNFILIYTNFIIISICTSALTHHNYVSMETYLNEMHETCPSISRLYSIGKSVEGRELYVMEITSNSGKHDVNKPEVQYIGNIHGNEVAGKEILLELIHLLCTQYGTDNRITNIVNSIRLHILPTMNPDGYEVAYNYTIDNPGIDSTEFSRRNYNSMDLNRDFPYMYDDCMLLLNREPETQAVMKWSSEIPFVLSASLHGGILGVIYSYSFTTTLTPDNDLLQALGNIYIHNHLAMPMDPCPMREINLTSNIGMGAFLYPGRYIFGDMIDYNYVCNNIIGLTLELSCEKFPEENILNDLWLENKESLLTFIEMSYSGIHGFVYSSDGQPISQARIKVVGNNKKVFTGSNGDYWLLMVSNYYSITASHDGFHSVTQFVHIPPWKKSSLESIIVNFTLTRTSNDIWSDTYDFRLLENLYDAYLDNSELYEKLDKLKIDNANNFIECNDGLYDNLSIRAWKITGNMNIDEKEKFHIALVGGLYASQPIGREILFRLVNHLIVGYNRGDIEIMDFMSKVVLHIIPVLDSSFENIEYECESSASNRIIDDLLKATTDNIENPATQEFKKILEKAPYDVMISIGGGGTNAAYTDDFFEVFKNLATKYNKSMQKNNCHKSNPSNDLGKYVFEHYGIPHINLALSCCNYVSGKSIPIIWRDNLLPIKQLLFDLSNGIILRVIDNDSKIIENAKISLFRNRQMAPFYTIYQTKDIVRKILPLGSIDITVTHPDMTSFNISKTNDDKILRETITLFH